MTSSDIDMVRLLLNDVDLSNQVFEDAELQAFLDLEFGSIKRAAAQAIDTNASNQALAAKVFRTQDLSTDGAKLADALRAHADRLRAQAGDEESYFEVVDTSRGCWPELTPRPWC